MFTFRKTFAATTLVAAALGLAALAAAGTASAGTIDDQFLTAIAQAGITGDPMTEIGLAHGVCLALDQGASGPQVVQGVEHNTSLSSDDAKHFALISAAAYCPQYVQQAPSQTA